MLGLLIELTLPCEGSFLCFTCYCFTEIKSKNFCLKEKS